MSSGAQTLTRHRAIAVVAVVLASLGCTAGCSEESTGPSMTNSADTAVTVASADGHVSEIDPDGGVLVLTDDCLEAPLVVTYEGGEEVTFNAPVCPGQELRIQDRSVRLVQPSQ